MINSGVNFHYSPGDTAEQLPNLLGGVGDEAETATSTPSSPLLQRSNRDILLLVFRRLHPNDLLRVCKVCRLWNEVGSQDPLWRSFHISEVFSDPVIDQRVWEHYIELEEYGLVFEKKGRLCHENKQHYIDVDHMGSEVERGQRFTILTLPKGLSVNKIIAFTGATKQGNATQFEYINAKFIEDYGDEELPETITIAITNGVFEGSRNESVAEHIVRVIRLKCEMPEVLTVMALAMMRFISSDPNAPVRLYGDDPTTATRCLEKVAGRFRALFGYFAPGGPNVNYDDYVDENHGVGGVRKFFTAIGL